MKNSGREMRQTQGTPLTPSQAYISLRPLAPKHLWLPPENSEMKWGGNLPPDLSPVLEGHFNKLLPPSLSCFHDLSNKHNATTNKDLKNEKTLTNT